MLLPCSCHASCQGKGHGKRHGKRHGKDLPCFLSGQGAWQGAWQEAWQEAWADKRVKVICSRGRPTTTRAAECGGVRPKFVAGGQGDGAVGSSGDGRNETFAAKRAGPLGARSGWRGTSSGERCLSHGSPCQRAPCGESRVFHTALRANVEPDDDRLNKNKIPPEPHQSSCSLSVREQKLRP